MKKYPELTFGDHTYVLRPGQMTARQRMKVRHTTGMALPDAMQHLTVDPDIDIVAVLYYAAAVQAGEDPNWDTIVDSVTQEHPITVGLVEGDDPET